MKLERRIFCLLISVMALLFLAACNGAHCSPPSLGNSGGSSGGNSGGVNTGGSTCGPGNNPGGNGSIAAFLYYLGGDNSIQGASLSTSGTFAALNPFTPPTLPSNSGNDMVIVDQQFLYLPQGDSLTIQGFVIDRTSGGLTPITGSPFATSGADSIVSDPAGHFLFAGNDNTGAISVSQINSTTGALTEVAGSPFSAFNLDFAHSLAIDGTGKFLYVSQGFTFLPIHVFSIDQNNGALSPIVGNPFALGVAGVRADLSGKFVIGLTGNTADNHLHVFSIDATTGAPAEVSGSPFATTSVPVDLFIHPNSQFVYSVGFDSNNSIAPLEGFRLDSTSGVLTPLPSSPFSTLPLEGSCRFEQGGSKMFCANATGTSFSVLDTNTATGDLAHTVPDLGVPNNFPFAVTN